MAQDVPQRLEAILSHLELAILVEEPNRDIRFTNQPFCDLFGIPAPPEALIGLNCGDMASDTAAQFANPPAFLQLIERALVEAKPFAGCRLQLADGRWVGLDYVPLYEDETYIGHTWLYRDVTDRAAAEHTVRRSEASLLALIENTRDPLWSVDTRLQLVNFNSAFRRLCDARTGWSPVAGAPIAMAIPEARRHRELTLYRRALEGTPTEFEVALTRPGAGPQHYDVHLAPILVENEMQGITATSRDITESQHTAHLLREAKDTAEDANHAKSDFLAHISHELRTPLNAMIGMVDLTLETRLDQRQRSYLESAQANSEALLDLISDVLDFSKIEAGEMDLERAPFDPREVVEEVLNFLGPQALRKHLTLRFHPQDTPRRVLGDHQRYRQVAMNLVGNAIKYTDVGQIDVSLAGGPTPTGTELELRVVDTGCGIAAEDHERVFSRFARSRNSRRTSGTGLGLAITASLVDLMQGKVGLRSTLGEGSDFRATIPVTVLPDTSGPPPLTGAVLIGSPDAAERSRWAKLAEGLGLTPQLCADGAALAEAALDHRDQLAAVIVAESLRGPPIDSLRGLTEGLVDHPVPWVLVADGLESQMPHRDMALTHRPLLRSTVRRTLVSEAEPEDRFNLRRGARVFVAEDHDDSRRFMVDSLRRAGHDAVAYVDGDAAREPLLERGYDLALLDLDMPGEDGVSLTERRRAWEKLTDAPRLPIVMVSGHATEDHRRRAQQAGIDAFVPKPLTRQRLLDVVDRIIDLRPRILVADDAAEARRLWSIWLSQAGAHVIEAVHGEEAVRLAQAHRPDAVILDMEMPILDGYGAAGQLRRLPEVADIPVIGLTGHTGSEARRRVLAAGCTSYLAKPVRREELLEELRSLLWAGTQTDVGLAPAPATEAFHDDLGDLVPMYLEERGADVVQLRVAVEGGHWDTIRSIGHRMKGTAVPYGFPEVEVLGKRLEAAASAEDPTDAGVAIDRLDQVLREALTTSRGSTSP